MGDEPEFSPPESGIFRHDKLPAGPPPISTGNPALIESISKHIARHFGPSDKVIHEIVSPYVHIDVHLILPTPKQPCFTLVTSGMSERPMKIPPNSKGVPDRIELVMRLPADWKIEELSSGNAPGAWPLDLLRMLTRFPHALETWLGIGHTIPNDENGTPYHVDTNMCCAMLAPSTISVEGFHKLRLDDGTEVHFLGLWLITKEEMNFKLQNGFDALLDQLVANNCSELLVRKRSQTLTRRTIPDDVFGDSFASRPARVTARWPELLRYTNWLIYPALILFTVGAMMTVAGMLEWPTPKATPTMVCFGVLALAISGYIGRLAWRVMKLQRIIFQHGALIPGIVVDNQQTLNVAALVNMSHSGSEPWYVVKVQSQYVPRDLAQSLIAGAQVPTVCSFTRASTDASPVEMGRWAEVEVAIVHVANSDPKVIANSLTRFNATEWDELRRALDRFPKPIQPGMYPLKPLSGPKPPPLPVPPPLPGNRQPPKM